MAPMRFISTLNCSDNSDNLCLSLFRINWMGLFPLCRTEFLLETVKVNAFFYFANLKNQLLSVTSQPSHPDKITLLRMRMFLFVTTTTNCNRFLMILTHLFTLYYLCRGFCWYHPMMLQVAIKSNQHNFSITFSSLGNITIKSVKEFTHTINIYQG